MGLGGIGVWQLVIILLIVFMLFGTKKLRNMGSDLGGALKGFKVQWAMMTRIRTRLNFRKVLKILTVILSIPLLKKPKNKLTPPPRRTAVSPLLS